MAHFGWTLSAAWSPLQLGLPRPGSLTPKVKLKQGCIFTIQIVLETCQLAAVIITGLLLLYIPLCYENFHFHVAHLYARLGYPNAQHILGQRYLQGTGVEKNEEMAMHWFRQAAGQGHPHSSFNLAVGALRNMTVALEEG
ncbi:hypothetical protein BTVI_101576 [Pitangus sulphuratus]|nr:hypothetical protein BTVI_101576 [Pitangus sulphuratus]